VFEDSESPLQSGPGGQAHGSALVSEPWNNTARPAVKNRGSAVSRCQLTD
jgi:hypothetical protein